MPVNQCQPCNRDLRNQFTNAGLTPATLIAACGAPGQRVDVVRESALALGAIGPAASAALPALKAIAAKPIPHVGGVIDLTPAWAASRAIKQIEGKPAS